MSRHKTIHTEAFTGVHSGSQWIKKLTDERDDSGQQAHNLQSLQVIPEAPGYWFVALCDELAEEEEVSDS